MPHSSSSNSNGAGDAKTSGGAGGRRRGAKAGTVTLTALGIACTLVYLFLLLVPHWRLVRVDRELLERRLLENDTEEARDLLRGAQLRSRSANLFRECLWYDDGVANDTEATLGLMQDASNDTVDSALPDVVNGTSAESAPTSRCWLLDLRWAEGLAGLGHRQRAILLCLRSLFLLALLLLCFYFVALVTGLYACFSAALGRVSSLVLLVSQCLVLSFLVAMAVLQDATRRLIGERLGDTVRSAFPDGAERAVSVSTGTCCLVLLCLLVVASCVQLLLLLIMTRRSAGRRRAGQESKSGDAAEGEEDSNPLIM